MIIKIKNKLLSLIILSIGIGLTTGFIWGQSSSNKKITKEISWCLRYFEDDLSREDKENIIQCIRDIPLEIDASASPEEKSRFEDLLKIR